VFLEQDAVVRFTAESEPGDETHITTNTPQIVEELKVGDTVLLDDGHIELKVLERISTNEITCKVINGGLLGEKKGINVPGLKVNIPALTEKDKRDALFALGEHLDYLGLSFVRSHEDIIELRQFLQENLSELSQHPPLIVAKIEKPQALNDI